MPITAGRGSFLAVKIFTPSEASRTLPLVRKIVADVLERGRALRELGSMDELSPEQEDTAHSLAHELEELFEELAQVGCSFRSADYSFGLVDFPGLIEGKPVHLCWKDDEPELRYYHEPNAGFGGRKPIPAHLLAAPAPPAAASS